MWLNQKHLNDSFLLNDADLSSQLKMSLALHFYKDLIKAVPFFSDGSDDFLGKICMNLRLGIYMPGDFIIRKGDVGRELFIVNKGEVHVLQNDTGAAIATLYAGSFFGEIGWNSLFVQHILPKFVYQHRIRS